MKNCLKVFCLLLVLVAFPLNAHAQNMTGPRTLQLGQPDDISVLGDFDGDGHPDIAVWRPANGTWYILLSSWDYVQPAPLIQQWGLPGDIPVPSDYDGDGITDLAVFRPWNGVWYILTSTSHFTQQVQVQWGQAGDVPMPGAHGDIVVYRPSTNLWYID